MNEKFMSGEVTVVVTAYNSERYISRCIESVLGQSFLGALRFIVVDDGSTDGTADVVKSYGNRLEYVRLEKNSGPAVGRTTGLMMARTEFITFIDADDYWERDFVSVTVNFLNNHKSVVAVNTGCKKQDWDGNAYIRPQLNNKDLSIYKEDGAVCEDFYEYWATYRCILTGTVMMRTELAVLTGGQRPDLRLTQDLEFWGYLATFGKWAFVPRPLFVTDETVLTPSERLLKFKRRFEYFSGLTLESWKQRIDPKLSQKERFWFNKFLCHIFTTIVFANAYSMNFSKSYVLAKEHTVMLERKGWGKGLRVSLRMGRLIWPICCLLLRLREIIKAIYFSRKLKWR